MGDKTGEQIPEGFMYQLKGFGKGPLEKLMLEERCSVEIFDGKSEGLLPWQETLIRPKNATARACLQMRV